ncbi:cysteine--1-D-myo-inosityl 2-amino-2-deoxy-alpha-D-glucopyranoside ligase [Nostocoides jenkinsii]|uniref:L-cysteine:1D-myo-inositol 2-amino-2-deoxy-alpha-D-glucopyranoside ligase n=1 Tax=Nostocoides jenkinsii Ben 74 TaxID=1193518 RepID=A0A077MB36_9MICO|nr:cysteine--1-D-myo-inosityl 2-amino-2-deoxy-alpha-D-glucopyranoside ligase [Tetrasphaera jenkinsii]CCI53065.1 putative cysteinyl-tRNA synthetase 2 [Tetrasphaera jenkinsii Ben 74]
MHTWPALDLPAIPGEGHPLRLHDTPSQSLVAITGTDGTARMYVCGITPYDATHLGHAATYVTFDIIGRALRDNGIDVRYVENVTDVDEPLLERAERDGLAWQDLATAEIALFREDMTALGVLPPDELVGVVESIDLIAAAVRRLVDAGVTYEVSDDTASGADIYLDLAAASAFGEVSGWSRAEMDAVIRERGGDPDRPGKRDPLDPLLWRAARVDEPSWSPEGLTPGRPGWHIECTAIADAKLGLPIDIQGGGSDLVFPHHEMSAAQAEAVSQDFARAYVHQEMVGLDGAKMSKSKGNLVLVSRLRAEGIDPMAIRLLLLAHRYDVPWDFTRADLDAAQERLARWRAGLSVNEAPAAEGVVEAIRAAVADNLDTPRALAVVDEWAAGAVAAESGEAHAPGLVARALDALLGVRV